MASAAAKIEIEQIKIGGDQAGALKVDAETSGGTIALRQIKGGLPGGARFEFTGTIKDQAGEKLLEGDGAIRGVNIARVQSWLQKSGGIIDLKAEGPFWVAGHVSANDSGVRLQAAKAEIGRPADVGRHRHFEQGAPRRHHSDRDRQARHRGVLSGRSRTHRRNSEARSRPRRRRNLPKRPKTLPQTRNPISLSASPPANCITMAASTATSMRG